MHSWCITVCITQPSGLRNRYQTRSITRRSHSDLDSIQVIIHRARLCIQASRFNLVRRIQMFSDSTTISWTYGCDVTMMWYSKSGSIDRYTAHPPSIHLAMSRMIPKPPPIRTHCTTSLSEDCMIPTSGISRKKPLTSLLYIYISQPLSCVLLDSRTTLRNLG